MELTRFQKIMLAALAAMLVLFGGLMAFFHARPGVEFEGGLLRQTEGSEGQTVYSGRAQDTQVTVSVACPAGALTVVEFDIEGELHDVFEIAYPLAPIRSQYGTEVNGVRVSKNGTVVFEGGYSQEGDFGCHWYDADGEYTSGVSIQVRGGSVNSDPWRYYETTAFEAARFAFGPQTSVRGDPLQFAMAAFLSVLLALDVVFHKELFRWRHWAARDPEPTEEYLTFERVGWVICTVIIAALYLGAMVEIY